MGNNRNNKLSETFRDSVTGQFGYTELFDGQSTPSDTTYGVIQVVKESVISFTSVNVSYGGQSGSTSITYPQGTYIHGTFKDINCVSGHVINYIN